MSCMFDDPVRLPDRRLLVTIAPLGVYRHVEVEPLRISLLGEHAAGFEAHEQWRMKNRPEFYDQWQLDLNDELVDARMTLLNKVAVDCDDCMITFVADHSADTCPQCGH